MIPVIQLLKQKPSELWTVSPDTRLYDAIQLMNEKGIGALPVMHKSRLVGMISERDIVRKGILNSRTPQTITVSELMTTQVFSIKPECSDEECMAIMTEKRVRHLPVCDGDKIIGMISIGDVVKSVISHQQELIDHLEHVITWEEGY